MPITINHFNIYNLSFGAKNRKKSPSKRNYTYEEKLLRHEINTAAIDNGWRDVYTGKRFTKTNPPSVEHIIPFSDRNTKELPKDFQINGLDNLFPAGAKGNGLRGNENFSVTVSKQPEILIRLFTEMKKYASYKSSRINGEEWVKRLKETIARELSGWNLQAYM